MKFKEGDKVKIVKGTFHYGRDPHYNPAEVIGEVTHATLFSDGHTQDITVKWPHKHNSYRNRDLELATEFKPIRYIKEHKI